MSAAASRQMLALRKISGFNAARSLHSSVARAQEAAPSASPITSPPGLSDVAALRRKVQDQGARGVAASRSNANQNRDPNARMNNRSWQRGGGGGSSSSSYGAGTNNRNDPRRRSNTSMQRGGQSSGARSDGRNQVRRDGASGRGRQQQQQQHNQQRGGRSGRNMNVSRGNFEIKRQTPTPTQDIFPVTDWQLSAYRYAQGFTRVPYRTPTVTIESLRSNAPFDAKTHKPLYEAEKALKLHYNSKGVSFGPFESPTLVSRPRTKKDDVPKAIRKTEGGNLAEEKLEARAKVLREKFGGDYQRWEKGELGQNSINLDLNTVEGQAAEALSHNDDLGPSLKLWTANTVKTILGKK